MMRNTRRTLLAFSLLLLLYADKANAQRPELVVQTGHSHFVISVAFSPDGKTIASGSVDQTIKLWDVESGKELRTLAGHYSDVNSVAFSPDGKTLASGSGVEIKLWSVGSGKEMRTLTGHSEIVNSIAFSPDGKMLASGSLDGAIKLWDIESGKEMRTLTEHSFCVNSIAFSPDGKTLASGSRDKIIRLWNVESGRQLRTLAGHSDDVLSIAFHRDGKTLASGSSDKAIKLWDIESGKELRTLAGQYVYSVAFSPNGKLLAGSSNNLIKLWDVESGKEVRSLAGHSGDVHAVAFSPDGRILASGSHDRTIKLWDVADGKELQVLAGHSDSVESPTFSPDGKTLASESGGDIIKLWDIESGKELRALAGPSGSINITSFAFSPNGKMLATGSWRKTIKLWDVASNKELRTLVRHSGDVSISTYVDPVAFSPDGRMLASGCNDHTLTLWEVESSKELRTLAGHSDPISSIAFSPSGKMLASASWGETIKLWDVESGKELHTLAGHSGGVESIIFSPDGRILASGSTDRAIKVWDVESGKELRTLAGHSSPVYSIIFSPDGKLLASGSLDNTIKLWDVESGKEARTLAGHSHNVTSVAFSPDGKTLVSGSDDKTIKLWDVASGKNLLTLIPLDQTDWVAIDADGRFDATPNAQKLMYWRVGNDIIEFEQLKERYYEPGLIQKVLGFNKEPLRQVEAFNSVKLPPKVTWTTPAPGTTQMTINLANRGGGIGKVQVLVNGKEVIKEARPDGFNPDAPQSTFTVDLKDAAYIAGQENRIEVIAWNYDAASRKGYVSSPRGPHASWTPQGKASDQPPELYAIIGGISDYAGEQLHLNYAAKDAEEFAHALELGATALLGKARVHITLLATGSTDPRAIPPTKENFRKAFEACGKAKPTDILLVYLAGHGVTLQQGSDLYLYLTQEARSTDAATLADEKLRESVSISSEELTDWTSAKKIKALKQVMILDTCAAGAAAASLIAKRDLPSDQIRALDRLKDRTGFFVLMGSAADAVSYEASRYGQGLLTYTLLQALKGARLREGIYADVNGLFDYAADTVPQMARNIGGIQRPVIISPQTGGSFDIGRYTAADQAQIRLSQVKPLILRPHLQNKELDYDDLKLVPQLRQALREASYVTARGASEAMLVYVDADEMADAVTPSGSYVVEGDKVKVAVRLIRNDKPIATVTVEGTKSDKEGLIRQIIQSITQVPSVETEPRKSN